MQQLVAKADLRHQEEEVAFNSHLGGNTDYRLVELAHPSLARRAEEPWLAQQAKIEETTAQRIC
jgi:hypothetical protein